HDTATTPRNTLSLHDALPICAHSLSELRSVPSPGSGRAVPATELRGRQETRSPYRHSDGQPLYAAMESGGRFRAFSRRAAFNRRSEEHTSELQSRVDLVCRLL